MAAYTLYFERPGGGSTEPAALEAQDLEAAKFEAALSYALASGDGAPEAYRIVSASGEVVFRYP